MTRLLIVNPFASGVDAVGRSGPCSSRISKMPLMSTLPFCGSPLISDQTGLPVGKGRRRTVADRNYASEKRDPYRPWHVVRVERLTRRHGVVLLDVVGGDPGQLSRCGRRDAAARTFPCNPNPTLHIVADDPVAGAAVAAMGPADIYRERPATSVRSTSVKSVAVNGVETEDPSPYIVGDGPDGAAVRVEDLLVGACEQAHRPVGAEEEPLLAEPCERVAYIGNEVRDVPAVPSSLGNEAGELACHVFSSGKSGKRIGPLPVLAAEPHPWLGKVVDHEADVGVKAGGFDGGGQLPRTHEEVVGEARLANRFDSALDVVAK
jgi:hypothetical protein